MFDPLRSAGSQEKDCVTLRGHGGAVYGTCFTQDGQFLISASEDTTRTYEELWLSDRLID